MPAPSGQASPRTRRLPHPRDHQHRASGHQLQGKPHDDSRHREVRLQRPHGNNCRRLQPDLRGLLCTHSLNNYQRRVDMPQSRGSNARLMFFIDSPVLASRDGPVWKVTDGWPSLIIQTLAHEF